MKATEQYFSVVLFIMLVLILVISSSVDEIIQCDHSLTNLRKYISIVLSVVQFFYMQFGIFLEICVFPWPF